MCGFYVYSGRIEVRIPYGGQELEECIAWLVEWHMLTKGRQITNIDV